MKFIIGLFSGLGILGFFLMIALFITLVISSLVGLYLAFSASILLGIIVLFVEPMPLLIGLAYLFANIDLAQKIVEFFSK